MTRCVLILCATLVLSSTAWAAPSDRSDQVEIEVFSDFQCPYCASLAPALRELQSTGVDGMGVTITFKSFPLTIHERAPLAHQAALAAAEQGKFWEMHDVLFANRQRVALEDLLAYAKQLHLDMDRFRRDLDSERIKRRIAADVTEGERRGVNGTPTFYIRGVEYVGTKSVAQLQGLIREDRQRARALAAIPDALLSRGPVSAPVTVEFFADLQSPVTRPAFAVLNDLLAKRSEQVRLQFRNLPLAFHPQATLAHEAAVTAAKGGRFWEFVAYVLDHQDSWREQDLPAAAARLGLDARAFSASLERHDYGPRVTADLQAASRRGIRGSPVVIVNGTRIDGVPSLLQLIDLVDRASSKPDASSDLQKGDHVNGVATVPTGGR